MKDLSVVTMLNGQTDLREPVQDLILSQVVLGHFGLAFVLSLILLDLQCHVASIGVVHDNTKLALLRLVDFFKSDDVRVIEHLEDFCFTESRLLVILTHLLDVNLFHHGMRL